MLSKWRIGVVVITMRGFGEKLHAQTGMAQDAAPHPFFRVLGIHIGCTGRQLRLSLYR